MKESIKSFVIGFSGRIGSGKSSVSERVAAQLDCSWVSFGDHIRRVAQYLGIDASDRKILQSIGNLLVDHPRSFCGKLLEHISYSAGQQVVIDGIRHKKILDEIRTQVAPAELVLVHIEADDSTVESQLHEEGETDLDIQRLERDATESDVIHVLPYLADISIRKSASKTPEAIVAEILEWIQNYSTQKRISESDETVVIPRVEYERLQHNLALALQVRDTDRNLPKSQPAVMLEAAPTPLSSSQDKTNQAVAFYVSNLRPLLEPHHNGKYVAIHPDTQEYVVELGSGKAFRALRAKQPAGQIVLYHVGPADSGLKARLRGEQLR